MTVVVDTRGPRILVGQYHEEREGKLVLLHVDEHRDGDEGLSKDDFVARAVERGPWPRRPRVVLSAEDVTSIRRLGDVR
jgi:hypothetical protein